MASRHPGRPVGGEGHHVLDGATTSPALSRHAGHAAEFAPPLHALLRVGGFFRLRKEISGEASGAGILASAPSVRACRASMTSRRAVCASRQYWFPRLFSIPA